ncbi:MAG: 4-hydroxythreonine-4-phosphate dehydrogenase PdxA [Myxococcota bacterium]
MVRIGITLGDPAGIGPDVVAAALREASTWSDDVRWTLFGPSNVAASLRKQIGQDVAIVGGDDYEGPRGGPSAASGRTSLHALSDAIEAAKRGEIDAISTAPISKEALALAGSNDRGHTEILARELGIGATAMSFFSSKLRTALVTTHLPLADAVASLRPRRIIEVAELLSSSISLLDHVERPRIAIAALNPHAGEAGLLGTEERAIIEPAVVDARARGLDVHGPIAADSVFRQTLDGEFDGVVSMYHDQALIPLKLLGWGESTNVTLGLSHPRTSPDHGTAFDRVGSEELRSEGMVSALQWAARLAQARSAGS